MKKVFIMLLVLVYCFSGCGEPDSQSNVSVSEDGVATHEDDSGTFYANVPLGYEMPYESSNFTQKDIRVYAEKDGAYYNVTIAQIFDLSNLTDDEKVWFIDGIKIVVGMVLGNPTINLYVTDERNGLDFDAVDATSIYQVNECIVIEYSCDHMKYNFEGAEIHTVCMTDIEGTFTYTNDEGETKEMSKYNYYGYLPVVIEEVHDAATMQRDLASATM